MSEASIYTNNPHSFTHALRMRSTNLTEGDTAMSDPLLKISNHHAPASGDPPIIEDSKAEQYIGYFENMVGEQWIFTRDRATGVATLRGGDIGWNQEIDVTDGTTGELTLNASEAQWLECCLLVSGTIASS
jgi:hypothetical protein